MRFSLAKHEVVIVGSASVADEVSGAEERSRGGADFFDFGDVLGHGGRIDQDMLVESGKFSVAVSRMDSDLVFHILHHSGQSCLGLVVVGLIRDERERGVLAKHW